MKIEVLTTQWAHDGGVLPGGVHEVEKPTKKLLEALAAAEATGAVKVSASADERAKMKAAVEPDSESLKAYEKAQRTGAWHEGNLGDYIASRTNLLENHADDLSDETKANLTLGIEQATSILREMRKGASYEDAAALVARG